MRRLKCNLKVQIALKKKVRVIRVLNALGFDPCEAKMILDA